MGLISLPAGACITTSPECAGKEVAFLTLAECQSPLAQYLGLPVPGVAKQSAVQSFHMEYLAEPAALVQNFVTPAAPVQSLEVPMVLFVPQIVAGWTPFPMAMPLPSPNELQQQIHTEIMSYCSDQSFGISGIATSSSSESGNNDMDSSRSTRASPSATRRQRRERAAVCQSHGSSSSKVERLDYAGLMRKLEVGETAAAIAEIRGSVRRLTFEPAGCRIVQSALEKADQQSAADMVSELHGCVRRAIASPHGNYVIQKVVDALPIALSRFVVDEILEDCSGIVRHRFGCRVMCRILEHSGGEANTWMMANEVVKEAVDLLLHNFGHHVIESILEHGLPEHKHQIAVALHSNLAAYVVDRHATYVIESALKQCPSEDQQMLIAALISNTDNLAWIAETQSGFHIVKALLAHSPETRQATMHMLQPVSGRLQSSQIGYRVVQEMQAYMRMSAH